MMLLRVRFSVRRMLIVVAVSAGSLAFGSGFEVRYRSCHLCHNREQIDTKTSPVHPRHLATRDHDALPLRGRAPAPVVAIQR